MLPPQRGHYFRYDGSLTTPPCLENVIWTVFSQQQTISKSQLDKFRGCFQVGDDGEDIPLVDNYRPPQALYNRKIYSSFLTVPEIKPTEGASSIVTSSVIAIVAMLAVLMFWV
jgi:hypothetical protein